MALLLASALRFFETLSTEDVAFLRMSHLMWRSSKYTSLISFLGFIAVSGVGAVRIKGKVLAQVAWLPAMQFEAEAVGTGVAQIDESPAVHGHEDGTEVGARRQEDDHAAAEVEVVQSLEQPL